MFGKTVTKSKLISTNNADGITLLLRRNDSFDVAARR
jgi:hypothetical protein